MPRTRSQTAAVLTDAELATVFIVDPDPVTCESVADLVRARKVPVMCFPSGEDVWEELDMGRGGCAVIELDLPGMSGIQLQERMTAAGIDFPVVMTAMEADVAVAVRAMRLGAVDFLQKPCHPLELWESIQTALEKDRQRRRERASRREVHSRLDQLTDDEQQILQMVLDGKPNKLIAHQLDVSLRTIDFRRANIFRKMQARSLVELAQIVMVANGVAPAVTWSHSYGDDDDRTLSARLQLARERNCATSLRNPR